MKLIEFTEGIPLFAKRRRSAKRFWDLARPQIKFLYNIALRYSGNSYDAEDMVQETVYTAFKKFAQLRDESKCKSWLFAILRNVHLKSVRRSGRLQGIEYSEEIDYINSLEEATERLDAEQLLERKAEATVIQQILDKVPEKYQSPILLYYFEDMSYQEISEFLEIPIGTVMSRLARAKKFLKKEILRLHMMQSLEPKLVKFEKIQRIR